MPCPQCHADPGSGPLCAACGALQPLPPKASPFAVLGTPVSFFLDPKELEARFKALQRQLHPDRFTRKEPRERRLSLEWTTAVNDAWRSLKDPVPRAASLLRQEGIEVEKEAGGGARQLPFEVLEEVLGQREALAEAKARRDLVAVRALAAQVKERTASALRTLEDVFRRWEQSRARECLEEAADAVTLMKFQQRFQQEVEGIELTALEQGWEASNPPE